MNKIGVLLIVAGLILLCLALISNFGASSSDPRTFIDLFFLIFPFPYSMIIHYGVSLTLIGFGIKKIIRG